MIFRKSPLQYLIILIVFGLLFLRINTIEIYVDSYGYIENHIIRSSFYPLFLDAFNIFGKFSLNIAVFVQIAFSIFAFFYFFKKNTKIFENQYVYVSYIILSLVVISNFSRGIITEAIALPVFILFCTYFIEYSKKELKIVNYLIILGYLFLLISIRNQFLFLIPTLFIWILFRIDQIKIKFLYFSMLILPVLLNYSVESYYHKVKHNQSVSSAYTGLQLLPVAIYNSNLSDSQFINDRELKSDFIQIKKQLLEKNIDPIKMDSIHGESPQYLYSIFFNVITHRIIKPYYLEKYNQLGDENTQYVSMDKSCLSLFKVLTQNNYTNNIKLYFNLLKLNGFNNMFFFVFYILSIIFIFNQYLIKKNIHLFLLFIAMISLIFNQILVTMVSFICYRYMVYNYLFIFFIILIMISEHIGNYRRELES